jgi:hypothetical protein
MPNVDSVGEAAPRKKRARLYVKSQDELKEKYQSGRMGGAARPSKIRSQWTIATTDPAARAGAHATAVRRAVPEV